MKQSIRSLSKLFGLFFILSILFLFASLESNAQNSKSFNTNNPEPKKDNIVGEKLSRAASLPAPVVTPRVKKKKSDKPTSVVQGTDVKKPENTQGTIEKPEPLKKGN